MTKHEQFSLYKGKVLIYHYTNFREEKDMNRNINAYYYYFYFSNR